MQKKNVKISAYAAKVVRFKARCMVGKVGYNECDLDDIKQELTLYLLKNLPGHDAARSSKNTYVSVLLNGKVAKMLRKREQEQRDHRREEYSLNEQVLDDLGNKVQRGDTITEDEAQIRWGRRNRTTEEAVQLKVDVSLAISSLPDDLRKIAEMLKTRRPSEVARILNVPRTTLNRAIERIQKAFCGKGLEDYL